VAVAVAAVVEVALAGALEVVEVVAVALAVVAAGEEAVTAPVEVVAVVGAVVAMPPLRQVPTRKVAPWT